MHAPSRPDCTPVLVFVVGEGLPLHTQDLVPVLSSLSLGARGRRGGGGWRGGIVYLVLEWRCARVACVQSLLAFVFHIPCEVAALSSTHMVQIRLPLDFLFVFFFFFSF